MVEYDLGRYAINAEIIFSLPLNHVSAQIWNVQNMRKKD